MKLKNRRLLPAAYCLLLVCLLLPIGTVYANPQPDLPYTVRNITDGKQVDFHPDFSPDGKQIVFSSKIEKPPKDKKFWNRNPYALNLMLMDADGGNRRHLTSGDGMDCFPTFTPDGKSILFVSNREGGLWDIWSIGQDGSELTRLTNTPDKDYSPRATPDGKHILFFSTPLSSEAGFITESVWIMDRDGKNAQRLTSGGKGDWYPAMNPDGKEIIFASLRLVGGSLWTIDRGGKNYKRLTYGNVLEFFPHYSPDGTKIAYVSRRGDATFNPPVSNKADPLDIWIMDRNAENKRRLTKNISNGIWDSRFNLRRVIDFISYYHLSWHPDGTKIAMTTWDPEEHSKEYGVGSRRRKEETGSYISIIEFDKDTINNLPAADPYPVADYTLIAEEEITSGEWEDFGPTFSPDGNTVVFASDRSGNWDIWSVDLDSKKQRQLTKTADDELAPVFSPDGKEIAFLKNPQSAIRNPQYDLWVMTTGGEQSRRLTGDIPVLSYPAWRPDANEIAFVSEGAEIWTYNIADGTGKKIASPWDRGEEESFRIKDQNYPFKEFLYRIDYNAAGDRIVFESNKSGNIEIWTMNRDGTGLTRITKGDKPHWNPIYSPNGKKIAYTTDKFANQLGPPFWPAANYNIWIADAETGKETLLTGEEQTDWNPAWSPDGKKIAYVTNRSGDFKHFSIWMLYLK